MNFEIVVTEQELWLYGGILYAIISIIFTRLIAKLYLTKSCNLNDFAMCLIGGIIWPFIVTIFIVACILISIDLVAKKFILIISWLVKHTICYGIET